MLCVCVCVCLSCSDLAYNQLTEVPTVISKYKELKTLYVGYLDPVMTNAKSCDLILLYVTHLGEQTPLGQQDLRVPEGVRSPDPRHAVRDDADSCSSPYLSAASLD